MLDTCLRQRADLDGEVVLLGIEPHQVWRGRQPHINLGMSRMEPREPRDEPFDRQGRKQLEAQCPPLPTFQQGSGRLLDAIERGAHRLGIGNPVAGEPRLAVVAMKQRDAEMRLELCDMPADRAL